MRKLVVGWAAPLALLCAPSSVQAQGPNMVVLVPETAVDEDNPFAGMDALMGAFAAEPLTPEQEARLPLAQALIEMVLPPGALGETMDSMFANILGSMMQGAQADARGYLAAKLGPTTFELDVEEDRAAVAATMLDPAWQERQRREAEAFPVIMQRVMAAMEPAMRTAMAELYAVHFNEQELADIAEFFATPSGASYARQSQSMASDPRLLGASMTAMPAMFESMGAMEADLAAANVDLPPVRSLADLSPTELKGMAQILGVTVEDLEYHLEWNGASEGW